MHGALLMVGVVASERPAPGGVDETAVNLSDGAPAPRKSRKGL